MNLTKISLKNPYVVITLVLMIVFLGLNAYFFMPIDLFPDTNPPQVVVLTIEPGASAADVSHRITEVLEKELKGIEYINNIKSTSRDSVSSIVCEFSYKKDPNVAVTDVMNVISRLKAELPSDIQEPRIFKITDAINPLMTIAISPKKNSKKKLSDVRILADNR